MNTLLGRTEFWVGVCPKLKMRVLIFREISGSHCGGYKDNSLLTYCAVQSCTSRPKFQRCLLPLNHGNEMIALMTEAKIPLKRRSTSKRLQGAKSQKAVIFILVAVRI
jgi:hypothetical protein